MSGTARVAAVLAAALAGALLVAVAALGGVLPGTADPGSTGSSGSSGSSGPALDRSGRAGLAPGAGPSTTRSDRSDRSDRRVRTNRDRLVTREPRARSASLSGAGSGSSGRRAAGPTRLLVPAADISMPVRPRGVDRAGLMALPDDPGTAGWYRWGAAPRDPRGAVVVAGHVDTAEDGIGPLAGVAGLRPGARVVLAGPGRDTTYRVTAVRRVPKRVLDLPALFRRTGPPALHLVTCGGEFDPVRRSYRDNVVAVAERVS